MIEFSVVIPARYASTRLPGKALLSIGGKSMLEHVHARAEESGASLVVIATDDERIAEAAEGFNASVVMTGDHHQSGTDRIAEVADILDWDDDRVVVNLQGDEPAMPAVVLQECANLLSDSTVDIATLASPFLSESDFNDPNCVKVVLNDLRHAIVFSRTALPFARDESTKPSQLALHHHGIYAYRCGTLRQFVNNGPSSLEMCEQLEQLRALSLGMTIAVGIPTVRPGTGIDTPEDLERAIAEFER